MNIELMTSYYERGLWTKTNIDMLLARNIITEEEYAEIIGE